MSSQLQNWTVVFETDELPFVSLETAVSYANGLISGRSLVKVIDLNQKVIRLEKREDATITFAQDREFFSEAS